MDSPKSTHPPGRHANAAWLGYLAAAGAVGVATVARFALDGFLGDGFPFTTYFLTAVLVAGFGRTRDAVLALVGGGLLGVSLFVPPRYTFPVTDPNALLGLSLHLSVGGVIVGMCHAVRVVRRRTERLLGEAAEQRERLRTTMASIGDAVITTDTAGRVTNLNPVAEELTGWANAEAVGQALDAVFRIVNETTRRPVENPALRALREGVVVGLANHTLLIAKDGTERPIDDSAAPIRCKDDEVVGCVLVFRDITERHAAERSLRESEERAAFVRRASGVGFWYCDLPFDVLQWDELVKAHFHLPPDAPVTIDTFYARIHPDDREPTRRAIERSIQDRTGYDTEYRTVSPETGAVKWVRAIGRTFYAADGTPTRFDGVTLDVTDQKQAADELRRQTDLLRAVSDTTTDPIFTKDRDCRLTFANPACLTALGLSEREAVGVEPRRVFSDPAEAEVIVANDRRIMESGESESVEEQLTGPHGVRTFVATKTPLRDEYGTVVGLVGISQDVTERKRADEKLRASEERFRTLFESMDQGFCVFELTHAADGQATDIRFVEVNPAFERQSGLRGVLGRSVREAVPDLEEFWFDTYEWVAATGEPTRFVHRAAPLDRWFEVYAFRLRPTAGGWRVGVLFTDVSERKRAEDELRASEERLRLAVGTAKLGLWSLDLRTLEMTSSDGCKANYGRPPADRFTYADLWESVHPDDRDRVQAAVRQAIDTRTDYDTEYRTRWPDGTLHSVLVRGRATYAQDGTPQVMTGVSLDITARRQAEEAVRASEERNSYLVALADTLRPLSDPVAVQAEASRMLGEQLGANRVVYFEVRGDEYAVARDYAVGVPSAVGRHTIASFGPDQLAHYLAGRTAVEVDVDAHPARPDAEKAAFARVQIRSYVSVPLVKNGVFVAGLAVHSGRVRGWTATEIALTEETAERTWAAVERARAEEQVRASEERYRTLFDSMDEGYCVIEMIYDPAGRPTDYRFLEVNPAFEAQSGLRQAVGRRMLEIVPSIEDHWLVNYAGVARTGEPIRFANEYKTLNRWFDVYAFRVDSAGGNRVAVLFTDITARKKAEEELTTAHQFLHSSIDALPSHIAVLDEHGVILAVNDAWRRFADENGYGGHNYGVGSHYVEECESASGECVEAGVVARGLSDVLSGRESYFELEYPCHSPTEQRWFTMRVTRFRTAGPIRVVVSHEDATKRRLAEEALRDADRRKDEFLATLAHELRNPLAPIRNGLQVMKLAGGNQTVERARLMMERQLTQMVRLVDDLMDVSRITRGKLDLRRERLDLRAVIDAAVETSRPLVEQAGHALDVRLPDEPIPVDGDPTRLAQVVSNLLTNSAKYTHRGGHVQLAVERHDGTAAVRVTDDGIGIPPDMLGRVFEMFTQVDRALEKTTGGLGIGLSLVKGLVEMHGGTIEAHSAGEGRGSEFVVRLPVAAVAPHPTSSAGPPDEEVPAGRRRILVVDDNADAADSLGQLLELLGNEVRTAHDGEAGVRVAGEFRPAVVLCDIGMPKMNGYDAARRIRDEPWGREVLLVALTGWGQDDDRRKTAEAGFDHHLVKPVETAALLKVLAGLSPAG